MAIDWSSSYEAPISLDAARLIGPHERRRVAWLLPAGVLLFLATIGTGFVAYKPTADLLPDVLRTVIPVVMVFTVFWSLFSFAMTLDWAGRRLDYWAGAIFRFLRLRNSRDPSSRTGIRVDEHKVVSVDKQWPGGVVEVGTVNLRMRDAATLAAFIQRLHSFYLGIRWPIQIVVRSTQGEQIERRWFIAVTAPTDKLLEERVARVVSGLIRAGLTGRPLNGDLYDSLQAAWGSGYNRLGPISVQRRARHVILDSREYLKGLLLTKWPRTIEPNWLAPVIDGDICCDLSLWLDPISNTDELANLSQRINDWEAAQLLNVAEKGFRDADKDNAIRDAVRTSQALRQRKIRVFKGSAGFVVRGKTLQEMHDNERLLTDQLRESVGDDAVLSMTFEHDKAPLLVVPTGNPSILYPLQIVSPAAAMTYPFSNSTIRDPGGANVGLSIDSKRINRLNLFERANPHVVIIGTSGAGKGYWVKVFFARLLALPEKVQMFVLQTEKDEYGPLVAHARDRGSVRHVKSLEELPSLLHPGNSYRILKDYKELVLIDLTKLPAPDKGEAISWMLSAIERTAEWGKPSRKLVVIDELGIVIRDKVAATAINTAYRRFRSIPGRDDPTAISRIGIIGMTQLPTDFLGHEHPDGRVYIGLAETHLYLRQKPTELLVTKGPLDLTPDEVAFLTTAQNGDALLVSGPQRIALHLEATPAEHNMAKT